MYKTILPIILVVTALGIFVGYSMSGGEKSLGGSGPALQFGNISSASAVVIESSASTTILAANSGRTYAKCTYINNPVGPASTAWIAWDATAVINRGFIVRSSESFEITPDVLYTGAVAGITTVGSASFACIEKTYGL